ncbi:MAG: hypothetical protein WC564_01365 [Patescibacteria group bacterium]|jgi:hypothetical protein
MPIKKVVPIKPKKGKTAKVLSTSTKKTVVAPETPINFPVRIFILVAILVFSFAGLFLIWWNFLINPSSGLTDSNSWIYSRHKFDQYRADNCGGDPLITVPECPRTR